MVARTRAGGGCQPADPLVLYRVHAEQASQRRRELQRDCQLRVARAGDRCRRASTLPDEVELAWRVGAGEDVAPESAEAAVDAYLELVDAFRNRRGRARAHKRHGR